MQRAIIIGAGPAGLTAAYELLKRTDIVPIVLEQGNFIGGLARTVNYKGNRIDIGGHRFFSKSDRVMNWWREILPIEKMTAGEETIFYQNSSRVITDRIDSGQVDGVDPNKTDRVMLVRNRKSRIFFLRKLFDYPIKLSLDTFTKLGLTNTFFTGISYVKASLFPIKPEDTLEQFFINRFGDHLYRTFFKSYTEKVWGVPCDQIDASWGAQRVKGLSLWKTVAHAVLKVFTVSDIRQKQTETSLIEKFLYPKFGPGQIWECVAEEIKKMGSDILTERQVTKIHVDGKRVIAIEEVDLKTGETKRLEGDYFFSTMPVKDLVRALDCDVPDNVRQVAEGLIYRDFITVGLLLDKLKLTQESKNGEKLISDNWIYIQESDVQVGRMQIFNNWSPYLVSDPSKVWIGLEYFCNDTDEIWQYSDEKMAALAIAEMEHIGVIEKSCVLDYTVIKVPKTYPAYLGTYNRFDEIRQYLDSFKNIFLIGRNGMHKYNNQDHSMLAAMTAVDNIINGVDSKENLWNVNTEQDYNEEK